MVELKPPSFRQSPQKSVWGLEWTECPAGEPALPLTALGSRPHMTAMTNRTRTLGVLSVSLCKCNSTGILGVSTGSRNHSGAVRWRLACQNEIVEIFAT